MAKHQSSFGKTIRDRRRQIDLTQHQVAQQIGTSTPYIGHLEAGKRHPSNEIVSRLADALGFDRRELYFLANPKAREIFNPAAGAASSSAWEEFSRNRRLHRLHNISAGEMNMLSQVALMGEVRSSRDFIYVLTTIRHALNV